MTKPSAWHTIVGLGFAVAGVTKLAAVKPQTELFGSWGWPKQSMQVIGAAELIGALLLVTSRTQRLGAALLTMTSGCVLEHEIAHGDDELVTPRTLMLLAAATGFFGGGARKARAEPYQTTAARAATEQSTAFSDFRPAVRKVEPEARSKVADLAGAAGSKVLALAGTGVAATGRLAGRLACKATCKVGNLAVEGLKNLGVAASEVAGDIASRAGTSVGRQARVLGRKAARQAGRAGDVAADYARHTATQATDRAKDLARSKGWA